MSIPVTYWPDGALQGNVPVNDSLQSLSALGQAQVEQTLNAPPTTVLADVGKMWQVGTSPTGVWATPTRANNLALCTAAGVWRYFAPGTNAWLIWDKTSLQMKRWDGSAWTVFTSTSGSTSKGHIDGLILNWVSNTALTVTTGEAYVEGSAGVIAVNSNIAKSSLSLSNNTWYHVYLFLNGGSADVEIVTTAPAAAYSGTARSKTGDTSRRYLGSVRTNGSAAMFNFLHIGDRVKYRIDIGSNMRALSNGTATTITTVSLAAMMPTTARVASLRMANLATNMYFLTGTSDSTGMAVGAGILTVGPGADAHAEQPVASDQSMTYHYPSAPSGGGAYIDVEGFIFER